MNKNQKTFQPGEIIIRQGDPGDSAYIIDDGQVEILIEANDGELQTIGKRGAGAIIGEMSLVDGAPRTATIKAVEPCKLLEITRDDFSRRLKNTDPVLKVMIQVILTRYRDTLTRVKISGESKTWPPPETLELSFSSEGEAMASIKIANEFSEALDKNDISLHYQPIVDLVSHEVRGFEALMRWEHPDKGYISPGIFIPIAEENGMILRASQWALKEACMALKRLEEKCQPKDKLFMGVNFSSRDFVSDNFVDSVYKTLSASDVKAEQLHIEITERMLMDQPENAKDTLEHCKKAGMEIAIDDFGTGYSSLSYLHFFPIDTLKIDRSFVMEMNKDETSLALIKSIIALGKNMKMKIIAEGVENLEEADMLLELGCDLAQGFYFAKPMPESDVISYLSRSKKIAV